MPRLYLSTNELNEHPIGLALASQISQLGTGVLDKLLFKASSRVDSTCRKRVQAPQSRRHCSGRDIATGSIDAGLRQPG